MRKSKEAMSLLHSVADLIGSRLRREVTYSDEETPNLQSASISFADRDLVLCIDWKEWTCYAFITDSSSKYTPVDSFVGSKLMQQAVAQPFRSDLRGLRESLWDIALIGVAAVFVGSPVWTDGVNAHPE